MLKDSDRETREAATLALTKVGAAVIEPLVAALNDEKTRGYAREALGKFGSPAVESLVAALRDPAEVVRGSAAEALG